MIICHAKRIEKQKYTIKKLGPENFLDNIYKVKQVKICVCISLTYYSCTETIPKGLAMFKGLSFETCLINTECTCLIWQCIFCTVFDIFIITFQLDVIQYVINCF